MDKLNFINEELDRLKEAGLLINVRTIEGPQGAWITVDEKRCTSISVRTITWDLLMICNRKPLLITQLTLTA